MKSGFFDSFLMRGLLLVAGTTILALTACAGDPDSEQIADTVPQAPVEDIPYIPDPSMQIWRPGYWAYAHGTFSWVPGEVIARPDPTAVWASAYWAAHSYGWSFQQGHWE